jgi:hypothetical protein
MDYLLTSFFPKTKTQIKPVPPSLLYLKPIEKREKRGNSVQIKSN